MDDYLPELLANLRLILEKNPHALDTMSNQKYNVHINVSTKQKYNKHKIVYKQNPHCIKQSWTQNHNHSANKQTKDQSKHPETSKIKTKQSQKSGCKPIQVKKKQKKKQKNHTTK